MLHHVYGLDKAPWFTDDVYEGFDSAGCKHFTSSKHNHLVFATFDSTIVADTTTATERLSRNSLQPRLRFPIFCYLGGATCKFDRGTCSTLSAPTACLVFSVVASSGYNSVIGNSNGDMK